MPRNIFFNKSYIASLSFLGIVMSSAGIRGELISIPDEEVIQFLQMNSYDSCLDRMRSVYTALHHCNYQYWRQAGLIGWAKRQNPPLPVIRKF